MARTKRPINEDYLIFSKRLRELRESLNMTQAEFSEMTGFTQATLSSYENSLKIPSLDIVICIAKKCNVSIDWLSGLSDVKTLNNSPNTYEDLLKMITSINESIDLKVQTITNDDFCKDLFEPKLNKHLCINFNDDIIEEFLAEWSKIKKLHDEKTIDDDIYNIWIERECNKYKDHLLFNASISTENPPKDSEVDSEQP